MAPTAMASTSASATSSDGAAGHVTPSRNTLPWPLTTAPAWPLLLLALALPLTATARNQVFLAPARFLAEAFDGTPPPAAILRIDARLRRRIQAVVGTAPRRRRLRYWRRDGRTAWILNEIGKERPITLGVVVDRGRIERLRLLIFRERRGAEVRAPAFTRQFRGRRLTPGGRLDRTIDGISGATLSVRALKRAARLALFLHRLVTDRP